MPPNRPQKLDPDQRSHYLAAALDLVGRLDARKVGGKVRCRLTFAAPLSRLVRIKRIVDDGGVIVTDGRGEFRLVYTRREAIGDLVARCGHLLTAEKFKECLRYEKAAGPCELRPWPGTKAAG